MPTRYDVSEIEVSSILLDDVVVAESKPASIGDDDDGILDLMVKFKRANAIVLLVGQSGNVELTMKGDVGGTSFVGIDTLRVKQKKKYLKSSFSITKITAYY